MVVICMFLNNCSIEFLIITTKNMGVPLMTTLDWYFLIISLNKLLLVATSTDNKILSIT